MRKVIILSLALIILLGIMSHGTSSYFSDTETSAGNTFTAWTTGPPKFCVSDKGDNMLYKYDASGNLVGTTDLAQTNSFPSGVSCTHDASGYLEDAYVLDQSDKGTYLYIAAAGTPAVSRTFLTIAGSGIGNPKGLAIDGDDIWVVSWGADNLYRYSLTAAFSGTGDINALQEIPLDVDNVNSAGLAIDSNFLYVLDSTDHQFYRYPRSGGTATVSKVLMDENGNNIGGPPGDPAGAMLDGTSLWVADNGTNKMYEYNLTELFNGIGTTLNAASQFDLDSDNSDASGV